MQVQLPRSGSPGARATAFSLDGETRFVARSARAGELTGPRRQTVIIGRSYQILVRTVGGRG